MMDYAALLQRKLSIVPSTGIKSPILLECPLFPHQLALTTWALNRGRAAIFAETGFGKTRMELLYAHEVVRYTRMPVLIVAPLAVSGQTKAEGNSIGIEVTICRNQDQIRPGINITNYERIHLFDPSIFGGVILDESSIIKHHDAKTFSQLTVMFRDTQFKLAATATPAPNDWTELGTHAEWLGICTRAEMLSEYFTHDSGDVSVWRLKGHAKNVFWKWVSTWGAMISKPSDLGFDDSLYVLPPLRFEEHIVDVDTPANGMLFALEAYTLSDRREARKNSLAQRVTECARIVNAESTESWIVWCDLNAESKALTNAIDGAVEITGSDSPEIKEARLSEFSRGNYRVLISKPSICGWGLNWQHVARMAFVGVTDSFEAYYQAVRRCWRFGQSRQVNVHLFASKQEGAVMANLRRKEQDARSMSQALSKFTRESVLHPSIGLTRQTNLFNATKKVTIPSYLRSETMP